MQNPLSFHQYAHVAAEAALAAQEQGKYWEMHDKLFANQQALDRPSIERYAQELGLNLGKFKTALDSQKFKDRIKKEQDLVTAVGASGTPAFFINGRKLSGAQPVDRFAAIIDEELKKADELLKKGVKPDKLYDEIIKDGRTSPAPPSQPAAGAPPTPAVKKIAIAAHNPVKGPKLAKVTIVEFSEFQ